MTTLNGELPMFGLREPVCTVTHALAALWAIYAAAILWRMCRHDPAKRPWIGAYALSLILLFLASSLYHAVVFSPERVAVFRRIDMSMVYVLIAGTHTPALAVMTPGRVRTGLLRTLWTMAAVGVALRWFVPGDGFQLHVALYLMMGWLGLWPLIAIVPRVGYRGVRLAVVGGLLYTIGAICDVIRWPVLIPGYFECHQLLHVLGFAGSLAHYAFVLQYIVPCRLELDDAPSLAAEQPANL